MSVSVNNTALTSLCKPLLFAVAFFLLESCGTLQPVRVLPEGSSAITASIGGPMVGSKSPIGFAPSITAGAMYGVSDAVTAFGSINAVTSAFAVAGITIGAAGRVAQQNAGVPEITAAVQLISFAGLVRQFSPRLYPDASVAASWDVGGSNLVYIGSHATMQWKPGTVYISPYVGALVPLSTAVSVQIETMWQAANISTSVGIFEGASSIAGYGSFGVFIGGVFTL